MGENVGNFRVILVFDNPLYCLGILFKNAEITFLKMGEGRGWLVRGWGMLVL